MLKQNVVDTTSALADLELKCGIEIHQQLFGRKLFSPSPTIISENNEFDFEIKRYIRAAAGESGKIDIAASEEQKKQMTYLYQGSHVSAALVETDSMPPLPADKKAVFAALQISKLLKSNVSPVIQVMRKTIADGSNTSGFQRTALIARGGEIKTDDKIVRIENISLEEDSCKIISKDKNTKTYHLDRLGIPLIEIGTAPDITSPKQCRAVAKKIGSYLRSLPNCKRGLGSIRQDVNVSILGGERVEVKGAQDLKQIPTLVEMEMLRQHNLLKIRKHLKDNEIELKHLNFTDLIFDLTEKLHASSSKILLANKKKGGSVFGMKVPGFAGLLGLELAPNYRLGTELSGRAKIKAGVGGIFHSDELPNYGITEAEISLIKEELNIVDSSGSNDAFILVADQKDRANIALKAVYERLQELYVGVPKEVRKALPNQTTSYLRPIPGAARMYPETDVPLIYSNSFGEVKPPELLEQKSKRLQKTYSLSKDLADFTIKSGKDTLFEQLAKNYSDIKSPFIAQILGPTLVEIKRKYKLNVEVLNDKHFEELFSYLQEGKINKDQFQTALMDLIKGEFNLEKFRSLAPEKLREAVQEIVNQNPKAPFPALMGKCMQTLRTKASGKDISKELDFILWQQKTQQQ